MSDRPRRSFESYGFRVILLLLAAFCAYRAVDGGGWHLWIVSPGLLIWALAGVDFDREWEWWGVTLPAVLFAGQLAYWLLTLKPGVPFSGRLQLAFFMGGVLAGLGVLVSGRIRRVWSFTRPAGPCRTS